MSRRPNIQSARETIVERALQADRRRRNATMRARAAKAGAPVEPYITCYGRGPVAHSVPKAVQRWIVRETRAQLSHYRAIVAAMDRLTPLRDEWVKAFHERITGPRGFSVHAGQRRTIPKSEIAARPRRAWRVVW